MRLRVCEHQQCVVRSWFRYSILTDPLVQVGNRIEPQCLEFVSIMLFLLVVPSHLRSQIQRS